MDNLERLAQLHRKAFNRLRSLEEKVSALQDNAEQYAADTAAWMHSIHFALQRIGCNDVTFQRLLRDIETMIPTLEHTHVYMWGSRAGLPGGVGACACGDMLDYSNNDNDLYDNSPGSTANRGGKR